MTNAIVGLPLDPVSPPLRVAATDGVRIGHSRISLDVVIEQYENGMTPEDVVRAYDTLELADVYAVIAYYLRHRDAVQAYLKKQGKVADELRTKIENEHPPIPRDELLARRNTGVKSEAPIGQ